jgi:hypothetical protein
MISERRPGRIVNAVVFCIVVLVVGAASVLYQCVQVAFEAEKALHSYDLVVGVLGDYLERSNGKWPRSWEELGTTVPARSHSDLRWPEDFKQLQKRVQIDFDLTTSQVAAQDEEHFSAVEHLGPFHESRKETIMSLLATARRFANRRKERRDALNPHGVGKSTASRHRVIDETEGGRLTEPYTPAKGRPSAPQ